MIKNELEKSIKKFKLKFNSNLERIDELEEYKKVANLAKKETTIKHTLIMSFVTFAITLFVLMFTFSISGNISATLLPFIYGIPLIGGPTIIKFMNKHYQVKERVKDFLQKENLQTEEEILEKELACKINIEKLKNKNEIIKQALDILESKNECVIKISSLYNVEKKDNNDKDTLKQNQEEIKNNIKVLIEKLNSDTIKNILQESFMYDRDKFFRFAKPIGFSTLSACGAAFYTMFPLMLIYGIPINLPFSVLASIFGTIFLGTIIYFIKRQIDRDKAFNYLNNTLKKDKLSKYESEKSLATSKLLNNSLGIETLIMELAKQLATYEEYNNLLQRESTFEEPKINDSNKTIDSLDYLDDYTKQDKLDDDKIKKYTP